MRSEAAQLRATLPSSVAFAFVQIVLGLLAIAAPMIESTKIVVILAWLLMFDGVAQLIYASRIGLAGRIATWTVLVAGLYVGAGLWLIREPLPGLTRSTFVLILFFLFEGLIDVIAYFVLNKGVGSIWLLLGGLVTVIFTLMIARIQPSNSSWVLGMLVGVSVSIAGAMRMLLALVLRRRPGHEARGMPLHRAV